jgi:hypothetical protein
MPLLAPCAGHPATRRAHSRLVDVAPLAPRHRQILALQATRRFITTTVVLVSFRQHHSGVPSQTIAGLSSRAKIIWFNLIP